MGRLGVRDADFKLNAREMESGATNLGGSSEKLGSVLVVLGRSVALL